MPISAEQWRASVGAANASRRPFQPKRRWPCWEVFLCLLAALLVSTLLPGGGWRGTGSRKGVSRGRSRTGGELAPSLLIAPRRRFVLVISGDIETNPGPVTAYGLLYESDLDVVVEELSPVNSKWKELGSELHVRVGGMVASHPSDGLREVLQRWLTGYTRPWHGVVRALRSVGEGHLASEQKVKYGLLEKSDIDTVATELDAVSSKWYTLGKHFGLHDYELDPICTQHSHDEKLCLREVISKRMVYYITITWSDIVSGLGSLGDSQLADHLETKYCSSLLHESHLDVVVNELTTMSAKWESLGQQFGIPSDYLDDIRTWYPNPDDGMKELIKVWLQQNYHEYSNGRGLLTWSHVVLALKSPKLGELQLGDHLKQKYLPDHSVVDKPSASREERAENEETDAQLKNLLEKYRHQGTIRHKSLKCLFTGPPRVGKTTLRKRMMKVIKNLMSSGVISTSGGIEKPITVVIREDRACTPVVMGPNYMDWQLQHDLLDEAQIVLQFIDQQQPTRKQESVPEELQSHIPFEPGAHIPTVRDTSQTHTFSPSKIHPNPSPTSENKTASFDDAKKLMEEVLTSRGLHSIKDIEKTTTIYLMDTGGQPEFHEIMPIILQGPALHMVLFNLAFDLNEPIPVRFCQQDGTNAMISYESNYTGIQMIHQLLSSLYCLSKDSSTHSHAVLIGTHLDKLRDLEEHRKKRIAEINDSIKKLVANTEFYEEAFLTYPVQDQSVEKSAVFVPIDNYNGSEEEIEQLQAFLKQVIDNHFDPVELPSSWHLFHLVLRHRYENSPGVCTLADCEALAKGCGLDKDDVPNVLRYIHQHLGTILYYEDVQGLKELVICDPNVLFQGIFHLVVAAFAGDRAYHTSAAKIRKTGEIPVRLLNRINAQPSNSPLTNEHILELLKHFKILTNLHSGDDSAYFMPCLLQPDTCLEISCEDVYIPPLLVRFDGSYIPIGVFSALVVKLSQGLWEPDPASCYRNHILFFTDGISSVELVVYPAYLEFRVTTADLEGSSEVNEFCMGVRKTVVDTLKSALELHEHTRKVKFQLGFYCPGSFLADGQSHFCGCLPSQNHINPKTFACSKSPHCQNQCRICEKYTIWFEYWKDSNKTGTGRDNGHARHSVPDNDRSHLITREVVSSPLTSSTSPTSASPREEQTGSHPFWKCVVCFAAAVGIAAVLITIVNPDSLGSLTAPHSSKMSSSSGAAYDRPDLLKLLNLPSKGGGINIPEQIGTNYRQFGIQLLDDKSGAEVNAIVTKHREDAEQINIEILRLWVGGKGKPLSWDTLIDVLKAIGLNTLTSDIQDSLQR